MALSGKVAFNTAVQVISKVIGTVVSLAAVALVTRYLGSYGFGQYTTAITFVTFFSIAGDLGLTLITAQMISHPKADQNRLLSNLFTFRLVTAAAVLLLAPIIVLFFPYDPIVKHAVIITSFAFFFILLNQVFVSLFQKELRADRIGIAEVVSRLLVFFATALAIWYNFGIIGIIWAMVVGNLLSFLIHYYYSRAYAKISLVYDKEIWRDIMKRSWPLVLTIVLNLIYLKTDTLILSVLKTPSDVGLYGAAYKVIDVLVTIPFMVGGTVLPILAHRWQAGKHEDYQRAWQKIFNAMAMLAWPAIVGGFLLARPIMTIIAGRDFIAAAPILRVLIIAVGGVFFSSLFSYTMISFGKQKKLIIAYAFTAISSLILYLIFIPIYSYMGAAWVTVYSEISISLGAWLIVRREGRLHPRYSVALKALIAALIMGLILKLLPINAETIVGLIITVSAGALIYGITLWSIGAVKFSELKEVLSRHS